MLTLYQNNEFEVFAQLRLQSKKGGYIIVYNVPILVRKSENSLQSLLLILDDEYFKIKHTTV